MIGRFPFEGFQGKIIKYNCTGENRAWSMEAKFSVGLLLNLVEKPDFEIFVKNAPFHEKISQEQFFPFM